MDNEEDRISNEKLVGRKIRGLYETGWHTGEIEYFNSKLKEYFVTFDDGSSDYIKEDEIDGCQLILLSEDVSKVSGRVRKSIDYRKLADA